MNDAQSTPPSLDEFLLPTSAWARLRAKVAPTQSAKARR